MAALPASISAVYEDGFLKPVQPLALPEHQRVRVIVVPAEPDPARVRWLYEQADEWLAQQPAEAIHQPAPLSPATRARLDAEFDDLLVEIRQITAGLSEVEIAARVDNARRAVRDDAA
jgi:predicted DNA-binding antitoxin AbrB/MazE fold protein